jgi:hypothetical protein
MNGAQIYLGGWRTLSFSEFKHPLKKWVPHPSFFSNEGWERTTLDRRALTGRMPRFRDLGNHKPPPQLNAENNLPFVHTGKKKTGGEEARYQETASTGFQPPLPFN